MSSIITFTSGRQLRVQESIEQVADTDFTHPLVAGYDEAGQMVLCGVNNIESIVAAKSEEN